MVRMWSPRQVFGSLALLLTIAVLFFLPGGLALSGWNNGIIILSHPDYAIVTSSDVTISGTVSSSYNTSLTVDGEAASISQAGTWSKSIRLDSGENTITVKASGSGGTVTATLHLICTNGAPYITMISPDTDTYYLSENKMTVKASVYNGSEFHVYLDGSEVESTATSDAQKPGYTNVSAALTNLHSGNNSVQVKAVKGSKSVTKTVTLVYDDAPMVTIDSPANGADVTKLPLQMRGKTDNAARLDIYINNKQVTTISSPPDNYTATISSLTPGTNSITVKAVNGGKMTSKTISVDYTPAASLVYDLNLPQSPTQAQSYSQNLNLTGKVIESTRVDLKDRSSGVILKTVMVDPTRVNTFSFPLTLTANQVKNLSVVPSKAGINGTAYNIDLMWQQQPRLILQTPRALDTYSGGTYDTTNPGDNKVLLKGRTENTKSLKLIQKGQATVTLAAGGFEKWVNLSAGVNELTLEAVSPHGKTTLNKLRVPYTLGPALSIVSPIMPTDPEDFVRVNQSKAVIIGNALRSASGVTIRITGTANGATRSYKPTLNSQGNFSADIQLFPGENKAEITASDGLASTTKTINYIYDDSPIIVIKSPLPTTKITENKVKITGTVFNTVENGLTIDGDEVNFDNEGDFSYEYLITDPKQIVVKVVASNGSKQTTHDVTFVYAGEPEVICTSHSDLQTVYSNVVTIEGKIQGVSKPYDDIVVKVNNLEAELDLEDGTFSKEVTLKKGSNNIAISVKPQTGSSLSNSFKLNYSDVPIEGAKMELIPKVNGGTLKAFGDLVVLNITKGAYGADDKLVFDIRKAEDVDKDADDVIYVSKIVRIEGPDPVQPVTLTLKYIDGLRDNLTQRLGIFRYDGGDWESIGGKTDAKKKTVTADITETGTYVVMAYVNSFRDISGHWAQDDIEILMAKGVLEGSGRRMFYPDNAVTRAEFAKMLVKALNITIYEENEPTFRDVDEDYWGYDYIQTAVRAGIIKGKGGGWFDPEATVTRLEAAIMLARAGNIKTIPSKETEKLLTKYKDKQQIRFGQDVAASAIKAGIIKGTSDDVFNPNQGTTRAQSAKLLVRLMILQKKI